MAAGAWPARGAVAAAASTAAAGAAPRSYYEALGVPERASFAELQAAYQALRARGASATAQEAIAVLGHPEKRRRHDALETEEASERLSHWRVYTGVPPARPASDPSRWVGALACGPEVPGPAGEGRWVEADCQGNVAQYVGVVLGGGPKAVLTLCEVEVLEPELPPSAATPATRGRLAAARRYVEEYRSTLAPPLRERRPHYLQRAADLLSDALAQIPEGDIAALEQLYQDVAQLPAAPSADAVAEAPLLLLRARILERLAFSEGCQTEGTCCPASLTRTAAGCLAIALALAKLAGDLPRAGELYEAAVEGRRQGASRAMTPSPLMPWASFWQTCELYLPDVRTGAMFAPLWDPLEPSLQPLGAALRDAAPAALRADVAALLAQGGADAGASAFEPAYPGLVSEGGWERVLLYDGATGWNARWCGVQAAPRLRLCALLTGRLPGEAAGLQRYYILDNNEEVSIFRLLAPRTVVRLHNGGTNARLNLNLFLRGSGRTSVRVGGQWRTLASKSASPGGGEEVLVYDACYDHEASHEGPEHVYWLQVGIMHPDVVGNILARRDRGEL